MHSQSGNNAKCQSILLDSTASFVH